MHQQIRTKVNAMAKEALTNQFQKPDGHAYQVRDLTFQFLKITSLKHVPDFTFSPREARMVANAAYLHDVGKLLTPKSILYKRGALTPAEREKLQLHTMDGAMLLYFCSAYQERLIQRYAFEIALHHHERIDGSGYPDGLKGLDLAPWLQIVSLADAFAARMEDRPYRPAHTSQVAWKMILNGDCGKFNDRILRCLDDNQNGWLQDAV